MSATEELRRLLDERGIEHDDEFVKSGIPYCDGYEGTYWGGYSFGYVEPVRPKPNTIGSHPELTIHDCTPEQAIAATLGGGKLTAEQVRECVQHVYHEGYSDGSVRRGAHIDETDWQAIADELNAVMGCGKCEDDSGLGANGEQVFSCSECGCVLSLYDSDGANTLCTRFVHDYPRFCPACGRMVKR